MDGRAGRGAAAVRRALLGLALLAGTCVPALADYNVSGRFVFVDREFDANGFTGVEPQLPIRFATVEVVDGNKMKGSGVTDAGGNFLIHLVDTATRDIYILWLARLHTTTALPSDVLTSLHSADI